MFPRAGGEGCGQIRAILGLKFECGQQSRKVSICPRTAAGETAGITGVFFLPKKANHTKKKILTMMNVGEFDDHLINVHVSWLTLLDYALVHHLIPFRHMESTRFCRVLYL